MNLRIVRRSGATLPVECVYDGCKDGTHYWSATTPISLFPRDRLAMGKLPAHTAVSVHVHMYMRAAS